MFKLFCYALIAIGILLIGDGLRSHDGSIMYLAPLGAMFILPGLVWRLMLMMPDKPTRRRSRGRSFSLFDIFDGGDGGGGGGSSGDGGFGD